jgi:hypothetical protein
MRNRIPEVAEAAVIEDFYRGSNDSAFVRAILQKAPTTSEQLFRKANLYITTDERAQDLIGGTKPTPAAPQRDTNQQPDKRWEKRPREEVHAPDCPPLAPEEDLTEANARWTTSSTPSACTTRTCATPSGTVETSSIPWGTVDPSNLYLLPRHKEDLENLDSPNSRRRGGGAFPRVDREVNVIFGGHGLQESKRQQKLNDRQNWWQPLVLPPRIDGPNTRSPSPEQISGSTSTTRASTRSSSIR